MPKMIDRSLIAQVWISSVICKSAEQNRLACIPICIFPLAPLLLWVISHYHVKVLQMIARNEVLGTPLHLLGNINQWAHYFFMQQELLFFLRPWEGLGGETNKDAHNAPARLPPASV